MTVGSGEAFRYVVVHPGDHGFEARNPGAIFVALSGAKSAGGEGRDPDFAFHEDVLITMTGSDQWTFQPQELEQWRLHVLATQQQRRFLVPAYKEDTFQ